MNHIIELIKDVVESIKKNEQFPYEMYFKLIAKELEPLDTLSFAPSDRHFFILFRERISQSALLNGLHSHEWNEYVHLFQKLRKALENYGTIHKYELPRTFDFIQDDNLKLIIERDYKELIHILMPDGAWKSAVILAGSILEAILYDQLASEQYNQLALDCISAPKYQGEVKHLAKWKLKEMITVAEKIDCLPPQRAKSIDQVLRDYRNFVHPLVEIRSQHPCTQAEALMAQGALEAIINHFNSVQASVTS